jgi:hypothetical protein
MIMTASNTSNDKKIKGLDKKVLTVSHQIYPYVKQRLKVAENMGILPKNMYQSSGIIDEVILKIYEMNVDDDIDVKQLNLMMFSLANKKLFNLFEKEKWHTNTISTGKLLNEELSQLEEKFTVDGDMDLIMNEELDDISYHQDNNGHSLLKSDEIQQNIADFLDLKDKTFLKNESKQDLLKKMYRNLPLQTSNVVDLYIIGKLNLQEIAIILDSEIYELKRIIDFIKENFRKKLI